MASTNQTTNYGLPIYSAGDRASWVDTNQAFGEIDAAVHNAVETAQDAAEDVAGAVSTANEAKELALTASAGVETLGTTKQNATDNNLATTNKTVTGAINEVNDKVTITPLTNPISGSVGSVSVDNFSGYKQGNHYHIECALHTLTAISNAYSQPLFTCTGLPIISGNIRVGLATKDGSAFPMTASLHTDGYFYQIISNSLDADASIGIVADFIV